MPRSPLADAEALFLHALQPLSDLAAFGTAVAWVLVVGGVATVGLGLVGLVRERLWATPSSPYLPVPMTRTLPLLAALLLAAPALAQADPMARLAAFEGTYALDGEPHQDEGTFDGTLSIAPILGGAFQQWDWEMHMRGDGFTELALLRFIVGYDAATRSYTIHRFDSRDADSPTVSAGPLDPSAGRLQVDGDGLVMAWTMHNPDDTARVGTFRNRVRLSGGDLHIETEAVPDNGSPTVAIATTRAARR